MERAFDFVPLNEREEKPRTRGLTEIRGPYYAPVGPRYLSDVLETMHPWVDGLKYAGGAFALMPRDAVEGLNRIAHDHGVQVSTGGFIEWLLAHRPEAIDDYLAECSRLGFDIVEVSTGFITIPTDDWLRVIEKVQRAGLKAKPEIGIQFGAGGDTPGGELSGEGTQDPGYAIGQARRFLEAGAYMIMMESEGVTENADPWRTDVPARFINEIGLEHVMFEAADPAVFEWYIKNYGPEVSLFVDHSQIVQLSALRAGIWGTKSTWGRVVTYKAG